MLSRLTFQQIAAALRTSADTVEKLAVNNETDPKGAMMALARIMVSLADTATYTARGIAVALTIGDIVDAPAQESESSSPQLPALRCGCPSCERARKAGTTHTPRSGAN
jgi:hypothetical protein